MRAVFLALALVSVPAAAAEQFDLICKAKNDEVRYRIDLTSGEWCAGDCKVVMKIAEVTSGVITLYDDKPTVKEPVTSYNTINRISGEWRWYNYDPRYSTVQDVNGKCEPAEFTGFPAQKF